MPICTWLDRPNRAPLVTQVKHASAPLAATLAVAVAVCVGAAAASTRAGPIAGGVVAAAVPATAASAAARSASAAAAGRPCKAVKSGAKPFEIKLLEGDAIVFGAAADEASVSLPLVMPEGLDARRLEAWGVQVRRDMLADAALAAHFKVEPALASKAEQPPAISVKIQRIASLLPARYTLTVAFTHRCGWPVAPLVAKLERPAATLLPPGRVTVDVFLPVGFGLAAGKAPQGTLKVQPGGEGALSALRSVQLHEEPFRGSNGVATDGTLGVPGDSSANAGEALKLSLAPAGFEVGVAQGKALLRSPDLKAPLPIEFEVRTRLITAWVVAPVVAGIVFGWWLRVVLAARVEVARVRLEGQATLSALQNRVAPIGDRTFHAATRPLLEALRDALLRGDATALAASQQQARAAVDKAATDLAKDITAATAQLRELREFAAGRGVLPGPLQAAVDALPVSCDEAAQHLRDQNATDARAGLDSARQTLLDTLGREWPALAHTLAGHDRELGALRGLFDPEKAAERNFGEPVRFADLAYVALASELSLPDLSDQKAVLAALNRWRQVGRLRPQGLRDWAAWLRQDRSRLDELVAGRLAGRADLSVPRQALHDAVQELAAALESASTFSDPFGAVPALAERTQDAFNTALSLASELARGHTQLSDEQRVRHQTALDKRQLFAAVLALPVPPPSQMMSAADAARGQPQAATVPTLPALACRETQAKADRKVAPPVIDSAVLELMRERTTRALLRATFLQTLLVGLVTVAAAYAFFEERFIGTPTELLGLFFWGFTADVSVDGLLKLAGGWAAKGKM